MLIKERRINMKLFRFAISIVFMATLLTGVAACQKEGPAERAGKAIDKAVDDTKGDLEKAKKAFED